MQNQFLIISLFVIVSLSVVNHSFSEESTINTDNTFYEKSDIISIWGSTPSNPQNFVLLTIKDSDQNIVWTEKISLDQKGEFSTLVIAGISGWLTSGTYEIILESGQIIQKTTFFYDAGSQINPSSVVDESYVSQEDLVMIFTIASIVVATIFVYLARNIIMRKKTKYDEVDLDSKKNRDYEKYHSDWTEEEIFGSRPSHTIDAKEFSKNFKDNNLPDYYSILQVESSATDAEIKLKYRRLAKEYHPDRSKNSSEKQMAEINKAYEVLSNQKMRNEYDKYYKLL
jgi:molecular chaperone DnaJ